MTSKRLNAGARGIDFSGADLQLADIVKARGRFILRYSAGVGNDQASTQWKLCGPNELRDALHAGLDVVANSEWYASRVTEGAAAGRADGAADLAFWEARGLAKGSSIYVSWDEPPVPAKFEAVNTYLVAYQSALHAQYRVDCYAGTPVLEWLLSRHVIRYGWRPNASSWSADGLPYQPPTDTWAKRTDLVTRARRVTPAHLWQTGNYWFGQNADENLIIRTPVGSHLDQLSAPVPPGPPPAPKPPRYYQSWPHQDRLVEPTGHRALEFLPDGRLVVKQEGKPIGEVPINKLSP